MIFRFFHAVTTDQHARVEGLSAGSNGKTGFILLLMYSVSKTVCPYRLIFVVYVGTKVQRT